MLISQHQDRNREGLKKAIIIAGLGRFRTAGIRLKAQCNGLPNDCEVLLIQDDCLIEIARWYGIEKSIFRKDIRGYGFWMWKPLLIHHFSNADYDSIIYIDAGCDLEVRSLAYFLMWFEQQNEYDLILSRTGHNITKYTKPTVIDELVQDSELKRKLNKMEMFQAGVVFLKTNSKIKNIYKKITNLIQEKKYYLFNDWVPETTEKGSEFIDHRHDQSVTTLLLIQSDQLHRVGLFQTSLTPPDHLKGWSGLPPIIASRNSSAMPMYWLNMKYNQYDEYPKYIRKGFRFANRLTKYAGILAIKGFIFAEKTLIKFLVINKVKEPFAVRGISSAALAIVLRDNHNE